MEHSKEPWRKGIDYNSIVSDDSSGPMVNGAEAVEHYGGYMVAESVAEANARRIVACVNACAGLDTAQLELSLEYGVTVLDELGRVKAQRDELLAVLEGVLPWVVTQEVACHGLKCREPVCMSCSSDSEEAAEKATYAYEEARAVIQKVRGGE